jgi:hypothetical protein
VRVLLAVDGSECSEAAISEVTSNTDRSYNTFGFAQTKRFAQNPKQRLNRIIVHINRLAISVQRNHPDTPSELVFVYSLLRAMLCMLSSAFPLSREL